MMVVFDAAAPIDEVAARWYAGDDDALEVILARAGSGEIDAQRVLVDAMTGAALVEDEGTDAYLGAAELMGRMAAARGAAFDRRRLAGVLSLSAAHHRATVRPEIATSFETQCLLILNRLADEGCEDAARSLNIFSEEFSQEAVAAAAASPIPQRAITSGGVKHKLTPEQYSYYVQLSGKPAKAFLDGYTTQEWREMLPEERRVFLKEAMGDFRREVRAELKRKYPELNTSKGAPPPPPGFAVQ